MFNTTSAQIIESLEGFSATKHIADKYKQALANPYKKIMLRAGYYVISAENILFTIERQDETVKRYEDVQGLWLIRCENDNESIDLYDTLKGAYNAIPHIVGAYNDASKKTDNEPVSHCENSDNVLQCNSSEKNEDSNMETRAFQWVDENATVNREYTTPSGYRVRDITPTKESVESSIEDMKTKQDEHLRTTYRITLEEYQDGILDDNAEVAQQIRNDKGFWELSQNISDLHQQRRALLNRANKPLPDLETGRLYNNPDNLRDVSDTMEYVPDETTSIKRVMHPTKRAKHSQVYRDMDYGRVVVFSDDEQLNRMVNLFYTPYTTNMSMVPNVANLFYIMYGKSMVTERTKGFNVYITTKRNDTLGNRCDCNPQHDIDLLPVYKRTVTHSKKTQRKQRKAYKQSAEVSDNLEVRHDVVTIVSPDGNRKTKDYRCSMLRDKGKNLVMDNGSPCYSTAKYALNFISKKCGKGFDLPADKHNRLIVGRYTINGYTVIIEHTNKQVDYKESKKEYYEKTK